MHVCPCFRFETHQSMPPVLHSQLQHSLHLLSQTEDPLRAPACLASRHCLQVPKRQQQQAAQETQVEQKKQHLSAEQPEVEGPAEGSGAGEAVETLEHAAQDAQKNGAAGNGASAQGNGASNGSKKKGGKKQKAKSGARKR